MHFRDLIGILLRRPWLLVAGTALAMVGGYLALRLFSPWPYYQARATVIIDQRSASDRSPLQADPGTYVRWATQPSILESVVAALDLPLAPEELRDQIEVGIIGDTQLLEVSAVSSDPEEAADIANELVSQLQQQVLAVNLADAGPGVPTAADLQGLQDRLEASASELIRLSDELVAQQAAGPPGNAVARLEALISAAEVELISLSDELVSYELPDPPAGEVAQIENQIEEIEGQIEILTAEMLEETYIPTASLLNSKVNTMLSDLNARKDALDRLYRRAEQESDADLDHINRRISMLQANIRFWREQLNQLYEGQEVEVRVESQRLTQSIQVLQDNIAIWQREYEAMRTEYEEGQRIPLLIVDAARPPSRASAPRVNILVAGMTGMLLATGVIFLLETRNRAETDD